MADKKEEINVEELATLSGESALRQTKYTVPFLKFNGSTGKFALLSTDKDGKFVPEELGEEIEGVILKVRRTYGAYKKAPEGGIRYFSNEHNSFRDPLVLFEKRKDTRPRLVCEGNLEQLRTDFPDVRLSQLLYFLHDGKIVKVGVKGKSLGSFWEYIKEFEGKEHMFQFTTKISRHQETGDGGVSFYVMDFVKGEKSDLTTVAPLIKEVASKLEAQDSSFAQNSKGQDELVERPKPQTEEAGSEMGENTIKAGPKDTDEIKVENIPY